MLSRLLLAAALLLVGVPAFGATGEKHGTIPCAETATEIRAEVSNRNGLLLYNNGTVTIFHGQHNAAENRTLTAANGTPLLAGQIFIFEGGEMTGAYHCIVSSGSADLRWKETFK